MIRTRVPRSCDTVIFPLARAGIPYDELFEHDMRLRRRPMGWLLQSNDAPVIVVSTLIVAVLFRPLRQRIQDVIDRRFYRTKYDAVRVLQSFSAALHQEVDLDQLREQLLTVVQETMQPTSLSLWISPVKQQKASGGTSGESLSRAGERPGEDRSDSQ